MWKHCGIDMNNCGINKGEYMDNSLRVECDHSEVTGRPVKGLNPKRRSLYVHEGNRVRKENIHWENHRCTGDYRDHRSGSEANQKQD